MRGSGGSPEVTAHPLADGRPQRVRGRWIHHKERESLGIEFI